MLANRWLMGALLIVIAAGPTSGQRREDPEADRNDKLGTRPPPLPEGEGGDLIVTAPIQFCADVTRELQIRYYPPDILEKGIHYAGGSVIRLLAGPSKCQWAFDGLAAGDYDAVIQGHEDGRIVATTARRHVGPGVTAVITLEPVQIGIEGVITPEGRPWDQIPLADDLRIVFTPDGNRDAWSVPFNANGSYGVKLASDQRVCMTLERTPPLNSVSLHRCETFYPSLQRFDVDHVHIPPGVIRIEVPPVSDAGFGDFVHFSVSDGDDPDRGWVTSFKLIRGLRGEFFAELDREYRITLALCGRPVCNNWWPVLASSRTTLSSDHPVGDVKLTVGPVR